MKKGLQIFVSSTYTDLINERQAAVMAISRAGHIPAGMELFRAGDVSQQEIIKKWIEESDAFILIIGGRYGSLMPTKDKSYTQWEYEYAGEKGKPRYVILLSEKAIQKKIEEIGFQNAMELDSPQMHIEFVSSIKINKLIDTVDDNKDIEIGILRNLDEIGKMPDLLGWISGENISDLTFKKDQTMKIEIKDQKFNNQTLELDNRHYINCTFEHCSVVYKGIGSFGLDRCTLSPDTNWVFKEYSSNVISFFNYLYNGFGEAGKQVVEWTFKTIRDKRINS